MRIYEKKISGWGRYPIKECSIVNPSYLPLDLNQFGKFKSFTPRGLGRSYGDSSLGVENSLVIETPLANKFLSFDKSQGIISAMAGVSLQEIMDVVIPHGYFLPVVPGTRFVTLGGAIASNVHGKNHHHTGAIGNFIKSLSLLTEKGPVEVTPENNPLLFNATVGGLGLTGLITSAEVRLKKIETSLINARLIKAENFQEAISLSKTYDKDYEQSVTWVDCLATGKNLGRGIVMLGNHTPLSECPAKQAANPLKNKWMFKFGMPDLFPGWALNPLTIKAFNFGYYNKQFKKEVNVQTHFESWFFPLDLVSDWNRMYGRRGFVQYQFAIPRDNGEKGIQEVLEFLSTKKIGSFLAVLKIVREDTCLLPFALPGFTLALDIPLRKGIMDLLNQIDRLVLKYGGRIYMTKDSRLSPETFREMNPGYEKWLEVVRAHAPERKFFTLQAERLKL